MAILVILSAVVVALYMGVTVWRWKSVPESISALVFYLSRPWQWVWTIWIWTAVFLLTPSLIEAMPEPFQFIAFLTIAMLLFVGAMPLVCGKSNTAHYVLAIVAGIFSQVCVAFIGTLWLTLWLLFVAVAVYIGTSKHDTIFDGKGVFVLETICWLNITGCLLAHHI